MKKKVLFVINHLHCGGAEKSLISLLRTIDYSKYEVDLFLFKHEGLFFNKLPDQVNVLEQPVMYKYFDMPITTAVIDCMRKGKLGLVLIRLAFGAVYRTEKHGARAEQKSWKYLSKVLPKLNKKYDAAVGFLEKNPVYFAIENVNASKKIGFVHNDYDKLGMDPTMDIKYFRQLDHLVTVSEQCGKVLEERFPEFSHKVKVIQNIVSPEMINKMALEVPTDWDNTTDLKIVSVGRLNVQKNFEMAVEACKSLIDKGYAIKWYVIGEGEERSNLENKIQQHQLEGIFILLGLRENPYPYIGAAHIYVQPSRFEGKAIAIDEAKIMRKPIVVTNFSTAKDQIVTNKNGLIVDMNAQALCEGISQIIDDDQLRNSLVQQLSEESLGTESEIEKLYALI